MQALPLRLELADSKPQSTRNVSHALLLLLLTLAWTGSRAAAQPSTEGCRIALPGGRNAIAPGLCVRSTIDASDPKNAEDIPYEDWHLPLAAGQSVQIDMDALAPPDAVAATPSSGAPGAPPAEADWPAFDTYLELRRAESDEVVASNDDRLGSLNSTIGFTAPSQGEYVVRARPLYGEGGPYVLRVTGVAPPPAPTPMTGSTASVAIRADGPRSSHFGDFRSSLVSFSGTRGERVRLHGRASKPVVMLHLVDEDGMPVGGARSMESEAALVAVLPRTGNYTLDVAVPAEGEPTRVDIDLERRPPAAGAESLRPHRITAGAAVEGELGIDSSVGPVLNSGDEANTFHEIYELRVRRDEPLTVTLTSTAFDPVMDAGSMSVLGFAVATSDDDGGPGLSSRLVLRPRRSGVAYLRVRSFGGNTGPFRLTVARGEVPTPAED